MVAVSYQLVIMIAYTLKPLSQTGTLFSFFTRLGHTDPQDVALNLQKMENRTLQWQKLDAAEQVAIEQLIVCPPF